MSCVEIFTGAIVQDGVLVSGACEQDILERALSALAGKLKDADAREARAHRSRFLGKCEREPRPAIGLTCVDFH